MFLFIIIFSFPNVFGLAVTPSHLDFSNSNYNSLVVFNTDNHVKDFLLQVSSEGFSVQPSSLRIPPRSSMHANVSSSCSDCAARLYVREISTSQGLRIEPAIVVDLSSGEPPEPDYELDLYDKPKTSLLDYLKRTEILAFIILFPLTAISMLLFFYRIKLKKLFGKLKVKKRK